MSLNIQNVPKAWQLSIPNGNNYANPTVFTAPAVSLIIDASQCTGAITAKLNADNACVINIAAGQVLGWNNGDINVSRIAFGNASGSTQAVQVIAGISNA